MDNQQLEGNYDARTKLKSAISINDVVNGGAIFEVNFDNLNNDDELAYNPEELAAYSNKSCLGDLEDEDTYSNEDEPFETIGKKMEDVTSDGKIKKRILHKGYGPELPDLCEVVIDYNAYVEYEDDPFDSTYIRKRPHIFRLNDGQVIVGLDFAVRTMKINEKSQFLIHSDYAYGKLGCLQRVPPNATVLFEIELIKYVASGASVSFPTFSEEKQKSFEEIYKYALACCLKGNESFSQKAYKHAVKEYNIAKNKLTNSTCKDYDDQEKQQILLLRLHTNLVVCYTKLEEPRKACTNCNEIYNMCTGTSLTVPAKVYFNNARCLIMLSDYKVAEKRLRQAQALKPNDPDIAKEWVRLDALKKESHNREVAVAKTIFSNKNKNSDTKNEISEDFEKLMKKYCDDLKKDINTIQYKLPMDLTDKEIEYTKGEIRKHDLELKYHEQNKKKEYYIAKLPKEAE